jgi:hypothetical protein
MRRNERACIYEIVHLSSYQQETYPKEFPLDVCGCKISLDNREICFFKLPNYRLLIR